MRFGRECSPEPENLKFDIRSYKKGRMKVEEREIYRKMNIEA